MKISYLLLISFFMFLIMHYYSSCCKGRQQQQIAGRIKEIDCGNPMNNANAFRRTGETSPVSNMLRRGSFRSSYRRTFGCWKAVNVTEFIIASKHGAAIGYAVFFSLDKTTLDHLVRAQLTLKFAPTFDNNPIQVWGTVSGYDGMLVKIPVLPQENTSDNLGTSFDASNFLHDVAKKISEDKVRIKFYITCNCERCGNIAESRSCLKLAPVAVHVPSLRMSYI